ncbi:SIS domain-containing protein [Thermoactinomyces mirandus]|uniref:SIS domain-containing protein n=1 Tax=Thermoactinomyces mirandus TaxID=2756294 RepID=A0A7W1XU25_9BACL|nr:SIS domain-containing protein [Thermoactinomyces mirandus]MBA4603251.1 SIS domain-containing protein [Thermoactinomyces mirandus]
MLQLAPEVLKAGKAIYTATEIFQQPEVWKELKQTLSGRQVQWQDFWESVCKQHDQVRVIFTGAGTSAFAGDLLVPHLRKQNRRNILFEAVPTTDIVSNPAECFIKEIPTVLVSLARSGNSPESVATVALGRQRVDHFYQVVITCNKDGQLARDARGDEKSIIFLMPEKAHDQGFAMTSSFTAMMLTARFLFAEKPFDRQHFEKITACAEKWIDRIPPVIDDILQFDFQRIVYLGSGLLGQLSHEAALKMLELTAGNVVAIHESSLGFRHGPKSVLNSQSLVVLFMSQQSYTRKYDMDMLRELARDNSGAKVAVLSEKADEETGKLADWLIPVHSDRDTLDDDFLLALFYIIFAQTLALKKSLQLGITPDNPSPDGRVNRVVKGVTIYPFP